MKYSVAIMLLLAGCVSAAPDVVHSRFRSLDSRGNPTGGFWGVEKSNGVLGVRVDPLLVVPNYTAWLAKYGPQCSPPATPTETSFILLPNGDTWCNDITWLNYEDMKDHAMQDAKLQFHIP